MRNSVNKNLMHAVTVKFRNSTNFNDLMDFLCKPNINIWKEL